MVKSQAELHQTNGNHILGLIQAYPNVETGGLKLVSRSKRFFSFSSILGKPLINVFDHFQAIWLRYF